MAISQYQPYVTIGVRGRNGKVKYQTFVFSDTLWDGTPAALDFEAVRNAAEAFVTDYNAITAGVISQLNLCFRLDANGAVPSAAEADVSEKAVLSLHLKGPTEVEKIGTVAVFAPETSIFQATSGANYDVVNAQETNVQQFIANFDQTAQYGLRISDNEGVDLTNETGIKGGRRVKGKG